MFCIVLRMMAYGIMCCAKPGDEEHDLGCREGQEILVVALHVAQ